MALAARRAGIVGRIVGCDTDPQVALEVARPGLADSVTTDIEAVADADLVVISVPVGAVGEVAGESSPP